MPTASEAPMATYTSGFGAGATSTPAVPHADSPNANASSATIRERVVTARLRQAQERSPGIHRCSTPYKRLRRPNLGKLPKSTDGNGHGELCRCPCPGSPSSRQGRGLRACAASLWLVQSDVRASRCVNAGVGLSISDGEAEDPPVCTARPSAERGGGDETRLSVRQGPHSRRGSGRRSSSTPSRSPRRARSRRSGRAAGSRP